MRHPRNRRWIACIVGSWFVAPLAHAEGTSQTQSTTSTAAFPTEPPELGPSTAAAPQPAPPAAASPTARSTTGQPPSPPVGTPAAAYAQPAPVVAPGTPPPAYAQPTYVQLAPLSREAPTSKPVAPPSGLELIITGSALMGVGTLALVSLSRCNDADNYPSQSERDTCKNLSYVVGGGMVAVGIPLFIVGLVKRSKYKQWQESQAELGAIPRIEFGATRANVGLSMVSHF